MYRCEIYRLPLYLSKEVPQKSEDAQISEAFWCQKLPKTGNKTRIFPLLEEWHDYCLCTHSSLTIIA